MWEIDSKPKDWPKLGDLTPERVLDEYDGPRLFTVHSLDGYLLLAYECAEDEERERFLLVPADEGLIGALEENKVSLRDALTNRGWAWLVDRMRDGHITAPAPVDPGSLPDTAMPRADVRLNLGAEVLLRIRMVGQQLAPNHVPASVVKRTVDAATGAVKVLATHALSLLPSPGRPADQFRRYYDLPAVEFGFRSFEIAFGIPQPATQPELGEDERATLDEMQKMLSEGLEWATGNVTQLPSRTPEWSAIVEALARLVPPRSGSVESVDVSGTLTGKITPVRLTRTTSQHIGEARKYLSLERRVRTYQGFVREFDKDRLTFILRNNKGENILYIGFSNEHYDDALLAFETDRHVTVIAEEMRGTQTGELISIVFDDFALGSADDLQSE